MRPRGIIPAKNLKAALRRIRSKGSKVVFTNGVFDIIHRGHVDYLTKAKRLGDILIIGVNTDRSVRELKGPTRPVNSQYDRAAVLLALKAVDYVVFFPEGRPDRLIEQIRPDVLVKGADYRLKEIAGADFVRTYGGTVKRIPLTRGRSTSRTLKLLKRLE